MIIFLLLVVMNSTSILTGIICQVCLIFLFFEAVFGICLGCKFYPLFYKEKTLYCAGDTCEVKAEQEIQKTSLLQKGVLIGSFMFVITISDPVYRQVQCHTDGPGRDRKIYFFTIRTFFIKRKIIMKAIVYTKYGPPDVLQLAEVGKPAPRDNEMLVKVCATTVTPGVLWARTGKHPDSKLFTLVVRIVFGLTKPKKTILGYEVSGEVEAWARVKTVQEG